MLILPDLLRQLHPYAHTHRKDRYFGPTAKTPVRSVRVIQIRFGAVIYTVEARKLRANESYCAQRFNSITVRIYQGTRAGVAEGDSTA